MWVYTCACVGDVCIGGCEIHVAGTCEGVLFCLIRRNGFAKKKIEFAPRNQIGNIIHKEIQYLIFRCVNLYIIITQKCKRLNIDIQWIHDCWYFPFTTSHLRHTASYFIINLVMLNYLK